MTTDASCESVVTTQHFLRDANNPVGLLEEMSAKFLSKATGTDVDCVQMLGIKPSMDLIGIFAISRSCSGVVACDLLSLGPTKIAEILKDCPKGFRDYQSLKVFTMFHVGNGGTIKLLYA